MSPARLLGVVLAGGESRRFGRPKGDARLGGLTLVERAARTLGPLCDGVLVGRAPDLPDLRPGQGPLGGLEAALERGAREGAAGVVVLACDLPVVHTATLVRLVEAWRAAEAPRRTIAVADGPLQPLCGVWGVEVVDEVGAALDEGRRSARDFVRDRRPTVLVPAEGLADDLGILPEQLLHNVNRPEDVESARGLLLPPVVSVVGWKDSGKTTVAAALIGALVRRGVDACAAKHGHGFRLDAEGTDSWRFRHEGGARRVLLAGPDEMALLGGWRRGEPELGGLVRRHLRDADIVIAEGWKDGPWPAIEVRAPGADRPPLFDPTAPDADRFLAVIGGGGEGETPLRLDRADPALGERLADRIEARVFARPL